MFLVYPNYKNILYYNCSSYYAISIGLLSDKISNNFIDEIYLGSKAHGALGGKLLGAGGGGFFLFYVSLEDNFCSKLQNRPAGDKLK